MTRWRVSFFTIVGAGWDHVTRETDNESDARDQIVGLRELMAEGEAIKQPRLERADEPVWTEVEA